MNAADSPVSTLPIYHRSMDWDAFYRRYPPPDVFAATRWKWSADELRAFQNEQFLDLMKTGWQNEFYRRRWSAAGIEPGDIKSIDDIVKLPTFDSDDIKKDQQDNPPFGLINGPVRERLKTMPTKVQTSGGTTGKPRPTMYGPQEWEMNGLTMARVLYICGLRPGDIIQMTAYVRDLTPEAAESVRATILEMGDATAPLALTIVGVDALAETAMRVMLVGTAQLRSEFPDRTRIPQR